jgi:hypothetical protein
VAVALLASMAAKGAAGNEARSHADAAPRAA